MLRELDLIERFVRHGFKLLIQYNKRLVVPRQPGKPPVVKVQHSSTPKPHHSSCLITVVSGGQTGADRAALDWALTHGVECGGWCPKGRKAEDRPIDLKYPLKESPSA